MAKALLSKGQREVAQHIKNEFFSRQQIGSVTKEIFNYVFNRSSLLDDEDFLLWCHWIIAGGLPFDEFSKIVCRYDDTIVCGLVWLPNYVAYRCRTCGISPCMSLCTDCFQAGDHTGHDFNMFRSQAGGACDCGNVNVMRELGCCIKHGPGRKRRPCDMPPDLLSAAEATIPCLLLKLLIYLRMKNKENRPESFLIQTSDADNFLDFLKELSELGSAMREILAKVIISHDIYRNYVTDNPEISQELQTCYKMSIESLPHPKAPIKFSHIEKLWDPLVHNCFIDELLFWVVKYQFPQKLVTLFLSLLPDNSYKEVFACAFVVHYPHISSTLLSSKDRMAIAHRLIHASVQLLSVEDLALILVKKLYLLHVILMSLLSLLSGSMKHEKKQRIIDSTKQILKEHGYWPIVSDFVSLLSHQSIKKIFVQDLTLLEFWFELVLLFQGANANVRQYLEHVEYEPESYYSAFSAELELCATPMWHIISGCKDKNDLPSLRRVLMIIDQFLHPWLLSSNNETDNSSLSFHLPLHRYLSALVFCGIHQHDLEIDDLLAGHDPTLLLRYPLHIQATVHEIHCGMWVRNGFQIKGQTAIYSQCQFCNSMIDLDLHIIQLCACSMNPNVFVRLCIDRYGISDFLETTDFGMGSSVDPVDKSSQTLEDIVADSEEVMSHEASGYNLDSCASVSSSSIYFSSEATAQEVADQHTDGQHIRMKSQQGPSGFVSESQQGTLDVVNESQQGPSDVVNESQQGPSGVVSESQQGPSGVVSESQQGTSGVVNKSQQGPSGVVCSTGSSTAVKLKSQQKSGCSSVKTSRRKSLVKNLFSLGKMSSSKPQSRPSQNSASKNSKHQCDPDSEMVMLEGFLYFIASVQAIGTNVDVDASKILRLEMLTVLCIEDRTYSKLMDMVPEKGGVSEHASNADEILKEIALYSEPHIVPGGTMQHGTLVPLPQIWLDEYDPLYVMLRAMQRKDVQKAHDRYAAFVTQSGHYSQLSSPWPPFRPPCKRHPAYRNLDRIMSCHEMFYLLHSVLYRAIYSSASISDTALHLSIYLISLCLQVPANPWDGNEAFVNYLLHDLESLAINEKGETCMLNLLLLLYERCCDSRLFVPPSLRDTLQAKSAKIGRGDVYISRVIDKACELNPKCLLFVEHEYKQRRGVKTEKQLAEDHENRRKKAKERQEKMMKQFASKQKEFMKNIVCGMDSMEKAPTVNTVSPESQPDQKMDCIICNQSGVSTQDMPFEMVALARTSNVLGHRRQTGDASILPEAAYPDRYDEYARNTWKFLSNSFSCAPMDVPLCLLETGHLPIECGLSIQTCGHVLHQSCHATYVSSLQSNRHHSQYLSQSEFCCPVCRQLSNMTIPISSHDTADCNLERTIDCESATRQVAQAIQMTANSHSRCQVVSSLLLSLLNSDWRNESGLSKPFQIASIARANLEYELIIRNGKATTTVPTSHRSCIKPLFSVLASNYDNTNLGSLWEQITHMSGDPGLTIRHEGVPLMLADAGATLIHLLLGNPCLLKLHYFDTIVAALYTLAVVQSLAVLTCQLLSEQRIELAAQETFTCPIKRIMSMIIRILSSSDVYMEGSSVEKLESASSSKLEWDVQLSSMVPEFVEKQTLPFLQIAALLRCKLFKIPLPIHQDATTSVEFQALHTYLRLEPAASDDTSLEMQMQHKLTNTSDLFMDCVDTQHTALGGNLCTLEMMDQSSVSSSTDAGGFRLQATCTNNLFSVHADLMPLIRIWCEHLVSFSFRISASQSLLTRLTNFNWCMPSLRTLPGIYDVLFQHYRKEFCSNCQKQPETPALCLLCGQLLCFKGLCCSRRNKFECVLHSIACGRGTSIYLMINSSAIVIIHGARAAIWGSVYLDKHGEEDRELKRGKPLYLNKQCYDLLNDHWLTHNFDRISKSWILHHDKL